MRTRMTYQEMEEALRRLDTPGMERALAQCLDDVKPVDHRIEQTGREEIETHDAFGVVSASKVTGRVALTGAFTDAMPSCVELRISRSRRIHAVDTNTERYFHNGAPMLTIRLSTYQWAELVSSMNGIDVPCTLNRVNGRQIDAPPVTSTFERAFESARTRIETQGVDGIEERFDGLEKAIRVTSLSKRTQDRLISKIRNLRSDIGPRAKDQADWALRRLNEEAERIVSQIRMELGASKTLLGLKAEDDGTDNPKELEE